MRRVVVLCSILGTAGILFSVFSVGFSVKQAYAQLAISVASVNCTDATATERGVAIDFVISGLSYRDTDYTFQLVSPTGSILRTDPLNRFIPPTSPDPATLFFGIVIPSAPEGQYVATVTGSDGSQSSVQVNVPNCNIQQQPNTIVGQTCSVVGQNIVCTGSVQGLEEDEIVTVVGTATGTVITDCQNPGSKNKVPRGDRFTDTQQFTGTNSITVIGDASLSQLDPLNFPLTIQPSNTADCPSSERGQPFTQTRTISIGSFNVGLT
jgi:hypothetical protein